jgi:diacylglycerol kinase
MAEFRKLFASFRDSVSALADSQINADDLRGILWLALVGVVVVVVLSLLRGFDNRRPMGR